MDNTSTGSSPLTDGEVSKNDIGGRQSNNEDDDSKKNANRVGQAQPGSARKMNNNQQSVNQGTATWRSPVPSQIQGGLSCFAELNCTQNKDVVSFKTL